MSKKISKKCDVTEDFDWADVLGCAPSDCSNQVKKILHRGIHGILWDDIAQSMAPVNIVEEGKKNIILDQLKNNVQQPTIQHIRNTKRLTDERLIIENEINKILPKYETKKESIKQKMLKLAQIKSSKKSIELKKKLLDLKYRDMKNQMNDCKEMRSVCQDLLPSCQSDIDVMTINNCLSYVGTISSRTDKKEAWKYINQNINNIKITELWDLILKKRNQDSEEFFRHSSDDNIIDNNDNTKLNDQRLDVGIAKAYSQHINWTLGKYIAMEKLREHKDKGMYFVEKILDNDKIQELSDWLLVNIEISQLEAKKIIIINEIDKLKNCDEELYTVAGQLQQLETDILDINIDLNNTVQKLQKSLTLYEPAIQFLTTLKEKLSIALDKILSLHEEHIIVPEWTNINLSIELEIFQEKLAIKALDKIMLSGDIGEYRHSSTCMSNAVISHPTLTSATPILYAPVYHLVDSFNNQIINSTLKQRHSYINLTNKNEFKLHNSYQVYQRENDIISILDDTKLTTQKCQQEIHKFNSIYDHWNCQSVQEAMSIYDDTVHGATFNEWIQRFTNLLYIIQRNK